MIEKICGLTLLIFLRVCVAAPQGFQEYNPFQAQQQLDDLVSVIGKNIITQNELWAELLLLYRGSSVGQRFPNYPVFNFLPIPGPPSNNAAEEFGGPYPQEDPYYDARSEDPNKLKNENGNQKPSSIIGPFPHIPGPEKFQTATSESFGDEPNEELKGRTNEAFEGQPIEDPDDDALGSDPEHTAQEVFDETFLSKVIRTDLEPIVPIKGHDH